LARVIEAVFPVKTLCMKAGMVVSRC